MSNTDARPTFQGAVGSVTEDTPGRAEVDRFILDHIDSVPHLEGLLLLWRQRADEWTVDDVARRLWIHPDFARSILQDLVRERLVVLLAGEREQYKYGADPGNDRLIQAVAYTYRDEMIRISTMIHAKPSSAVRAFARAFRFKKEQE
jgi:predicted ArsR family transcriptional regulator